MPLTYAKGLHILGVWTATDADTDHERDTMTTKTNTYRIVNAQSGLDMGCIEARDESEALDIMAREAGYRDYDHACEVSDGGLEAHEVVKAYEVVET